MRDNGKEYRPLIKAIIYCKKITIYFGEQLSNIESFTGYYFDLLQDFLSLKRVITEKHFYFNSTKGFPCLLKSESRSTPHCLGKNKGRSHPYIDPAAIGKLQEFYRPFNKKFYELSGINFGWPWTIPKGIVGSKAIQLDCIVGHSPVHALSITWRSDQNTLSP